MHKKIIAFLFALLITPSYAAQSQYSIIVDAGSSGEYLHLFQSEKNADLPKIQDIFSEKNTIDLASFVNHEKEAGLSLQKLLDDAREKLKALNIDEKTVLIQVNGTENMRSLPVDTQNAIYTAISDYIRNNYNFSIRDISTLSGKMEGVYDWLAVNYLDERFNSEQPMLGILSNSNLTNTIAFSTQDTSKPNDEVTLNVNHKKITIFSKNFPNLGLDPARLSMNNDKLAYTCYPIDYPLNPNTKGNFNLPPCGSIYANIIKKSTLLNQLADFSTTQFVIPSDAYQTLDFFDVEIPDRESVEARIYYVCSTTWNDMQNEYNGMPAAMLSAICANAVYLDQLLFYALHLVSNQLWITDKINRQEIGWPLGMLLLE